MICLCECPKKLRLKWLGKFQKSFKKWKITFFRRFLAHNNPLDLGILTRLCINQFISNHIGVLRAYVMFFNKVFNHLPRWFSTKTMITGSMRTDRKVFERFKFVGPKVILELAMNNIHWFKREIASSYTRLICHDKKFKTQRFKNFEGLKSVSKPLNVFYMGEVVFINNQGAVSIKKNSLPRFNLLRPC